MECPSLFLSSVDLPVAWWPIECLTSWDVLASTAACATRLVFRIETVAETCITSRFLTVVQRPQTAALRSRLLMRFVPDLFRLARGKLHRATAPSIYVNGSLLSRLSKSTTRRVASRRVILPIDAVMDTASGWPNLTADWLSLKKLIPIFVAMWRTELALSLMGSERHAATGMWTEYKVAEGIEVGDIRNSFPTAEITRLGSFHSISYPSLHAVNLEAIAEFFRRK